MSRNLRESRLHLLGKRRRWEQGSSRPKRTRGEEKEEKGMDLRLKLQSASIIWLKVDVRKAETAVSLMIKEMINVAATFVEAVNTWCQDVREGRALLHQRHWKLRLPKNKKKKKLDHRALLPRRRNHKSQRWKICWKKPQKSWSRWVRRLLQLRSRLQVHLEANGNRWWKTFRGNLTNYEQHNHLHWRFWSWVVLQKERRWDSSIVAQLMLYVLYIHWRTSQGWHRLRWH